MDKTRIYTIGITLFVILFFVIPFGWLVKFKYEKRLIIRTEEYGPLISAQVGVCSKPEWVNALGLKSKCAESSGVIKMSPEKMAAYDVACTFFPCSLIDNNVESFLDGLLDYCSIKTWNLVTVVGALYIISVALGFVVKLYSQRDHPTYYPPNMMGMPFQHPVYVYPKQETLPALEAPLTTNDSYGANSGTTIFSFRKQKTH